MTSCRFAEAGERLERGHPVVLGLADPDEDPARERDLQRLGVAQRRQPQRGVLRRRRLVGDEVGPQRLDHQPLRCGHLAQPREVGAAERAEVRVREDPAVERALAGPRDVGDEVVEAELGEPRADARVMARVVAGQDEQLLDVAPGGAVDQRLDLVRRVQVRLMRRERAVLAVRHARARQRQRDVARERDPAAHPRGDTTEAGGPAGSGGDQVQQGAALELRRRRRAGKAEHAALRARDARAPRARAPGSR